MKIAERSAIRNIKSENLTRSARSDEGRNVIFQGSPGVGKTHLAIALGLGCAERGQRLLFLTALELARRMKTAFAQNRMPHYLKMLTTPKLLIVDEVGYLGLDHEQASLLFQVICSRYEKQAATIITSNMAFSEWGHVFAGDAVMASAALERRLRPALPRPQAVRGYPKVFGYLLLGLAGAHLIGEHLTFELGGV